MNNEILKLEIVDQIYINTDIESWIKYENNNNVSNSSNNDHLRSLKRKRTKDKNLKIKNFKNYKIIDENDEIKNKEVKQDEVKLKQWSFEKDLSDEIPTFNDNF